MNIFGGVHKVELNTRLGVACYVLRPLSFVTIKLVVKKVKISRSVDVSSAICRIVGVS